LWTVKAQSSNTHLSNELARSAHRAAAQVEKTFQTEIHTFKVNGETHFSNITKPAIPAALKGVVLLTQNGVTPSVALSVPNGQKQESKKN
jgi:subtilase family serine protease